MSIRARLLAGIVALVAAGLAVAALTTYEEQRSFLLSRVDQQARAALIPVSLQLGLAGTHRRAGAARRGSGGGGGGGGPGGGGGGGGPRGPRAGRLPSVLARLPLAHLSALGPAASLPPGTYGELIGPGGAVLRRRTFSYGQTAPPAPRLPAHPPLSTAAAPLRLFTIGSLRGMGTRYRAVAFSFGRDTVVVAVSLREADDTLHRLVVVQALVDGGVIVALVAIAWVLIRLGLRPLQRIGRVASEIARGDLSRRVAPSGGRTEIGRLGSALNEMLGQIEQAFAGRRESEDRLRRFLADASHELRTPLASIRGYAELFRLGAAEDPATLARAMSRIESEATRMGVLVEDLLALAALDQAPQRQPGVVDLAQLAEQAAHDTRVIAPGRALTLSLDGPAMVRGDPDQLRQMLANLLRNAVVHTPDATPVQVGVWSEDEPESRVRLRVRDHGPGLPPGAGERLFERFWRSEGGRSRGRGGAGLGLAIVRAITVAHGGSVRACDAPGGGACFDVTLPAAPAPAAARVPATPAAPATPASPSQESLSLLSDDSYPQRAQ